VLRSEEDSLKEMQKGGRHDPSSPVKNGGVVFDIQRFAIHDGYGIRTLVFMKGCPLRCEWCSNPESQHTGREIMFHEEKCIECGACIEACPFGELLEENWPVDNEQCYGCGSCVDVCYAGARKLVGKWMSVQEVLEVVTRDLVFYRQSGGGVTVGGGEPTLQASFVSELLKECSAAGVHTAVETCGHASWERFSRVLEHTDLLLFDLKHMNTEKHRRRTGVGNERILDNAVRAADQVREMIIRLPLIPDFNDSAEHIRDLATFIQQKLPRVSRIDILPYHSMGESKMVQLGRDYPLKGLRTLTREDIRKTEELLQSFGFDVVRGG
jgi:pyruvate formate lyase activating enzyme